MTLYNRCWNFIIIKIGIIFCQVINTIIMFHEVILDSLIIHEWNGGRAILSINPIINKKFISISISSCVDLWFIVMKIIIVMEDNVWRMKKFKAVY